MSKDKEDSAAESEFVKIEKPCSLGFRKPGSTIEWHLMGMGKMQIVYDDDMLCCRALFTDQNGKCLFGNVIDNKIKLEIENEVCIWSCDDYMTEKHVYRRVRAQFSSSVAAQEFAAVFAEAQEIVVAKWKNWK